MSLLLLVQLCAWSAVVAGDKVTFLVSPDTHFTQSGGVADTQKNARGIRDMNSLPGTSYPSHSVYGGAVEAKIRGVVVPGDLVDDGCQLKPSSPGDPGCMEQWANYTSYFQVTPSSEEARACKWPAFDGVGNHDGGNSTDPLSGLVRRGVIKRNRQRAAASVGVANYSMSANNLHYSWDWDGVHFVMLGVYPGTVGDCASGAALPGFGCCSGSTPDCWGWHSPEHSLEFLQGDLAKLDKGRPTVLFMHYGMKGFGAPGTVPWGGYSADFWWSTREAITFGQAIAEHNIVAIVHGHTHVCAFYQWDLTNFTGRVYDVYNAPALQNGGPNDPATTPSQYLVFEIDRDAGRLRAFQRVGTAWGTISHEKNITTAAPSPTAHDLRSMVAVGSSAGVASLMGTIRVRAEDTQFVLPPHVVV